MIPTKRMPLLIALTLLCALLLTACSGNEMPMKKAAGTYVGQYVKMVGESEKEEGYFSLILKADGTGIHVRDDCEFKITWTLDGDSFTMEENILGLSKQYTGTLREGGLDIFDGDPDSSWTYEYVYQKQ